MKGWFGIEEALFRFFLNFSMSVFTLHCGFAPLIRPCGPPSPRWGEEGDCRPLNDLRPRPEKFAFLDHDLVVVL